MISNHSSLKDSVVLVTGASRGLGKTLTYRLLDNDCYVIAGVRDINKAQLIPHPRLRLKKLDLLENETLSSIVKEIFHEFGHIDALGPINLSQLVLPYMRKVQKGRIVFISSTRAVQSHAHLGAYSTTKAALEAMAFDLAVTLRKNGILVSVVRPGPISTRIPAKS